MSQLQYWVWLSMRFGVRPKVKLALVEHFGTPRDVYFATEADYRVRVPLRPEELRLLQDKDLKDANRALAICDREHIRILTVQDAAYPQRLLQIYDPPLVLYVRGTLPQLDDLTPFDDFMKALPDGQRFIAYCDPAIPRRDFVKECLPESDVTILVGPEGDFSQPEIRAALDAGFIPVSLGDSRLRTETAGVFACAAIHTINQLKK